MKKLIRKLVPKSILKIYHWILAFLADFIYGHPSRKMTIVGVTGTTGKSTTVYLIAKVLEEAGHKVGLTSTFNYQIADQEWINDTKMTMPGRFSLQKILKRMLKAGCTHVVIETSSEGIAQYRHLGIDYDVAVFTNLSPEHIETHGSFANYKQAKGKLFKSLMRNKQKAKKVSVVNLDDKEADYFLQFWADDKWGYTLNPNDQSQRNINVLGAKQISLEADGSRFIVDDLKYDLDLVGLFNIYNALAAVCVGYSLNIDKATIASGLAKVASVPGRLEEIEEGQNFKVIVDYAHEPYSLQSVYEALKPTVTGRMITVLGSCGGGRDKARRPILGKLAAQYADIVIVTNEDPYDEDPMKIIEQVSAGAIKEGKQLDNNLFNFLDRQAAIKKALSLAEADDLVLISGKGAEQCIMGPRNEKIPWDDRQVVRSELQRLK